jgi:excisionase family DNA binding protein
VSTITDNPLAVKPERAAAMLDISRAKVYELLARGDLPSFWIDSSRRILVADIHKYMKDRMAAGTVEQSPVPGDDCPAA